MPTTVEDLVWYAMCFTITTGLPTIIVIAWNIQKLLHGLVVQQAIQDKWIEGHEKIHENLDRTIDRIIGE